MSGEQKKLTTLDLSYRKCSLCDTSFIAMLRLSLSPSFGEESYLLLCRSCYKELQLILKNWSRSD